MRYKRFTTAFLFLFLFSILLTGCGSTDTSSSQNRESVSSHGTAIKDEEKENYDTEIFGVVKAIDSVKKSVTIYDINNQLDMVFTYTSGTDIRDSYDKMITMDQIELGEIVDGYYYYSNRKLTKLHINKEAWTYNGVDTLSMNQTENIITIAKKKYQYDERIVITDGKNLLEPIDLNGRDELTAKGIGKYIYSLRVTKGHGYIRLTGEEAFLGGTIEVGYGIIVPIVEDMLIVAREGSYRVVLENGELQAVKEIKLLRDEEITLDFSDYEPVEERIGYVDFRIEPLGADLYINGQLINYAEPVKLNYGEHIVRVAMTGYEDFTGILNIGESTSTVRISLAEEKEEDNDDESSHSSKSSSNTKTEGSSDNSSNNNSGKENTNSSDSSGNHSDNGSSGSVTTDGEESDTTLEESHSSEGTASMGTTEIDEEHTITIQNPDGAKVYLDGTLKGTIPITIPKEIGTHTITLSKNGYTTKSYTVEVKNDGKNITFNFPDMTAISH